MIEIHGGWRVGERSTEASGPLETACCGRKPEELQAPALVLGALDHEFVTCKGDPLLRELMEAMLVPIDESSSASSMWPLFLREPAPDPRVGVRLLALWISALRSTACAPRAGGSAAASMHVRRLRMPSPDPRSAETRRGSMILDRLTERISIDWLGFGVTHGGFFDWFGPDEYEPWPGGREPEPHPAIVAAGGYCAPITPGGQFQPADGWEPWRAWYCRHRVRLVDLYPPISAPRGGIRFLQPPPIGHPSREWITDDPFSHLGPDAPQSPRWPARPAPALPPQPAQPTMNLLEPETRSISELLRLRLRRRR